MGGGTAWRRGSWVGQAFEAAPTHLEAGSVLNTDYMLLGRILFKLRHRRVIPGIERRRRRCVRARQDVEPGLRDERLYAQRQLGGNEGGW